MRIGCRLQAAVAKSVYVGLYHKCAHKCCERTNQLLCKIVEVETLRLPFLIVGDDQISYGLSVGRIFRVAKLLALRFALLFLEPFVEPSALFLSLRKGCTRVACHKNVEIIPIGFPL